MRSFMLVTACLALASLSGGAQAADAEKDKTAQEAPGSKMKCKRERVTGSLVQRVRICKTEKEWEESEQRNRDAAKETIDRGNVWGAGSPGS